MRRNWLLAPMLAAFVVTDVGAGTLLVVNKSAASVSLLNEDDYEVVATVAVGQGPHEVALSPSGRLAMVSNYGSRGKAGSSLSLIDVGQAQVIRTIQLPEQSRPHGVEWLDEERVAVSAEGIDSVLIVNSGTGDVTAQIAVDQSVAHMVTVAPDSQRAFTANMGSGTVSVVDLAAREKLADLAAGEGSEGIAVVGGTELWVSNREDGSVRIFDLATLETLHTLSLGGFPIRAEADDVRGRVYVSQAVDDALAVIDVASRALLGRVDFSAEPVFRKTDGSMLGGLSDGSIPVGIQLSGNGQRIYVAHTQADAISVIDADTLEILRVVRAGDEPDGMGWSAVAVER